MKRPEKILVALVAALGLSSAAATAVVTFANDYMARHWGGGNFPPLVGHLAVIAVGGLLLCAQALSLSSGVMLLTCYVRLKRSDPAAIRAWHFIVAAALVMSLFLLQCTMWRVQ